MSKRKSKVEARIEALCANHRFSTTVVYWKAVKILSRYRDIRNLPIPVTKNSAEITEKTVGLIREKFIRTYIKRNGQRLGAWIIFYVTCSVLNMPMMLLRLCLTV